MTQRDFYSLYAFFHNVPEKGIDGVRDRNPEPRMFVPTPEQGAQLAKRDADIKTHEALMAEMIKTVGLKEVAWEDELTETLAKGVDVAGPVTRFDFESSGQAADSAGEKIDAIAKGEGIFSNEPNGAAYEPAGKGWLDYGQKFGFEKDEAFSVTADVSVSAAGGSPLGKMDSTTNVRGWDIEFHGTRPSVHLIHKWPNEAIHIQAEKEIPADTLTHIAFSYDGSGKAAGLKLAINGVDVKTTVRVDNLTGTIKTDAPFTIGRRGGDAAPFHGKIEDVRIYGRALSSVELATLGGSEIIAIAKRRDSSAHPPKNRNSSPFIVPRLAATMPPRNENLRT